MKISKLIEYLNLVEDKEKEIEFSDIATNAVYRIFTIDKESGKIIIEDTGE